MRHRNNGNDLAWRIYFWYSVFAIALGSSSMDSDPGSLVVEVLDLAILVAGLRGLEGYVYRRTTWSIRVWSVLRPICILWSLGYIAVVWFMTHPIHATMANAISALLITLHVPLFRALYCYGRERTPPFRG
ncbi:MAG: hypothetical protein HYS20_13085 [Rhodocyclales bacterium]|nr:hypothetical protein [Rhodocyclales bacterium]